MGSVALEGERLRSRLISAALLEVPPGPHISSFSRQMHPEDARRALERQPGTPSLRVTTVNLCLTVPFQAVAVARFRDSSRASRLTKCVCDVFLRRCCCASAHSPCSRF